MKPQAPMKRLFLIGLLVLSGGPAYAGWIELAHSDDGMTAYYDPDTIREMGNLRKMWLLYDHATPQARMGFSYLSLIEQAEFDCSEERVRRLAQTAYAGKMRNGKTVYSDSEEGEWRPVAPGTIIRFALTYVCGKQ